MIDSNGSGTIDFTEFIMSVWNYCTFDMPSLIFIFAFNFYDVGNSGMLTMDEVKGLIKEVYGEDAFGIKSCSKKYLKLTWTKMAISRSKNLKTGWCEARSYYIRLSTCSKIFARKF